MIGVYTTDQIPRRDVTQAISGECYGKLYIQEDGLLLQCFQSLCMLCPACCLVGSSRPNGSRTFLLFATKFNVVRIQFYDVTWWDLASHPPYRKTGRSLGTRLVGFA